MTTRKTSRCTFVPSALARAGAGPALVLALIAGTAFGQVSAPGNGGGKAHTPPPVASPRSSTGDAASSMVSDRSAQEQSKRKVGQDPQAVAGDIKVSADQIVDLHIKDEDLTRVLELLAIQSQRNIIPTKSVNARVSANLYGVTFYEALDALLHPNGFGWMERANRIEVYTLEELKTIEAASRTRIAKVIKLNYLNAIDAGAFVEALLSEGGQIKTNGKTPSFSIPDKTPIGQDDYANSAMLVIYDFEENVNEIERLIKEIDTRPSQVLVEATILQTQLNEANAFGVDFSVLGDLNFSDFAGSGGPMSVVNGLVAGKAKSLGSGDLPTPSDGEGRAVVSSPGNTGGPGTLKIGFVESDVAVFLKMLDEVGDTTIISNPKVLALNRQSARVLVGRKVGYLNTTSTDTTTTQSVEFLDTGTQLYFRPFVSDEGLIRLELKPAVSEAVIRDTKDATGAAVTIPDEITNEIVTNVIVRDGQTVVLGGLFRESTQSSRRQVPFLGDIPLLGAAFRGHEDATARNEIIFMITPSIVSDQVLVMQGERGSSLVDRVRTGSRESLLPWSRERMSGQLMVEAERLASEGKEKEALWKIEQSLSMNHTQPEAIALRDRLSNKKAQWPGRGMLNNIVKEEAATRVPPPKADATSPSAPAAPQASATTGQTSSTVTTSGTDTVTPTLQQSGATNASQTFNGEAGASSSSSTTPSGVTQGTGGTTSGAPSAGEQTTPGSAEGSSSSWENQNSPQASTGGVSSTSSNSSESSATTTTTPAPALTQAAAATTGSETVGTSASAPATAAGTGEQTSRSTDGSSTAATSDPAVTDHNEQGGVESAATPVAPITPSAASTPVDPVTGQPLAAASTKSFTPNYIAAWTWFYSGFRDVFLPGPTLTNNAGPVNQAAPSADGQSQHDESVSTVPGSDQ